MEQAPPYRKSPNRETESDSVRPAKRAKRATKRAGGQPAGAKLSSVATPKQARSEATLQRLLDAAETLIGEKGFAAVSIAELAKAAGSSVGGFYARFRDKDEMLRALNEREHVRLSETLERLTDPRFWKDATLTQMVGMLLAAHDAQQSGRMKLMAAVLEATARDPERWAPAVAFRRRVVDAIAQVLLLRREEIRHPDPERAVRFALTQALAVTDQRALYAHVEGLDSWTDADVRVELQRSIVGYLTVDLES